MMKNKNLLIILIAAILASTGLGFTSCSKEEPLAQQTNKQERNHIKKGNALFDEEKYAEAEVEYGKALEANPKSAIAAYNMALALIKQAAPGDSTGLAQRADSLFSFAASTSKDKSLQSMAFYNRGNIAYNAQDYPRAIDFYKQALRLIPDDDEARYNLRMAQLKLKDQQQNQNQNQNKDQNKDQNQDQNKDQNQDQDQNQDKDQNQDQNQDQNKDQNQNQNQQRQPQATNMDEQSINQVLKAMEDKERATQDRMKRMQQQQNRNSQFKW